MTSTEKRIAYNKKIGIPFLDKMPEGWKIVRGASTAPNGYVWIHNCGNPFEGKSRTALLKV